jgi:hypothetical protein
MAYDVQPKLTSMVSNHEGTKKRQAPVGSGGIVLCDLIVSTCVLVK